MATPSINVENITKGFDQVWREAINREAASDGVKNKPGSGTDLWATTRGYMLTISHRYSTSDAPIASFERDMHNLWYTVLRTAEIINADDPAQDRLVTQLLFAREMGTLCRKNAGINEEAITPDGSRIWTDLPYLAHDLQQAWRQSMEMTPQHRYNLAAFTARLPAVGVCDKSLSMCALWLLREALETPQQLVRAEGSNQPSIGELLPACVAWFKYCSHKLLTLAVNKHSGNQADLDLSKPGELAQTARVVQAGFSIPRWLFWRQRFVELSQSGDEAVAREGRRGFDCMIGTGQELGYEIPGEVNYWAKVQKALTDELKRSRQATVSLDDIVVDLGWAQEPDVAD